MGCGKSKHAVSTENVLMKSKSKAKSVENNPPVIEDVKSDGNVNLDEVKVNEAPETIIKKEEEIEKGDEKEIFGEKDGKEKGVENHGNGNFGEEKNEEGKLEVVEVVEEKKEELKGEKIENILAKKDDEEEIENILVKKDEEEEKKIENVSAKKGEEEEEEKIENVLAKKEEEGEKIETMLVKKDEEEVISHDSPKETIETIISDDISGKSENVSTENSGGKDDVEGEVKHEEVNSNADKEEVLEVDEDKNVVQVDGEKVTSTPAAEIENAKATSPKDDVKEN